MIMNIHSGTLMFISNNGGLRFTSKMAILKEHIIIADCFSGALQSPLVEIIYLSQGEFHAMSDLRLFFHVHNSLSYLEETLASYHMSGVTVSFCTLHGLVA